VKADGAFLLASLATTLVTTLLFGCAPVLRMIGPRFAQTTRSETGFSASSAPSLGRNRARAALTVVQVALAVMLLVGAGLLGGSFVHLARFDLGYNPDDVLTFTVAMRPTQYSDIEQRTTYTELLDRLQATTHAKAADRAPAHAAGRNVRWVAPGTRIGRESSGSTEAGQPRVLRCPAAADCRGTGIR
jgi:hypothetical protein